ncbi:MAG: tetratricopeptide repeat-containing serine protease family protein [Pirellulaceae bacterium]
MSRIFWSCTLVVLLASPLHAQPPKADTLGATLGLSAETGSLPAWTKPSQQARQELGEFVRASQKGIFLVGHPKHGQGTAWVVSKKHRLLVTNAHVADIMSTAGGNMLALMDGSSQIYKVDKAWYHPGVKRRVGGVPVRSSNPGEGDVDPNCPDIAILQMTEEGPDLAMEFKMAAPKEFDTLFAQAVAIMGYPGTDTTGWPQIGETAEATFHDGVVSRLTDFRNKVAVPIEQKQFLQYTMSTWAGFSGSPIFLPSGQVVAVHNSAKYLKGAGGNVQAIPHGVRIDSLWELIAHHGLEDKIPLPVEKDSLDIKRWLEDDPADLDVRKAVALVDEGADLIYNQQKHAEGVAKCAEAAKLAPDYARTYDVRCDGYLNYWFKHRRAVDEDTAWKQIQYAEKDALKYASLNPTDPYAALNLVLVYNNAGQATDNDDFNEKALRIVNRVLESDNLPFHVKACAYSYRAIALDNLDRDDEAQRDHNEAVRTNPKSAQWLENRADFWHYQGRGDLEAEDYAAAKEIREGKK